MPAAEFLLGPGGDAVLPERELVAALVVANVARFLSVVHRRIRDAALRLWFARGGVSFAGVP